SLGHADRAAGHLEAAADAERANGVKLAATIQVRGNLVEAHTRRGAFADAERHLAQLEREADETSLRWTRGVAARGRGLLAENAYEGEFAEALELFGTDMTFEHARTQLCLAMRLRRAQQRSQARTLLTEALQYFEAAGAVPWAERARTEL